MTNARNLAQRAVGGGSGRQAKAEAELDGPLARLLMVAESYPDLKANQNFLALQDELSSTENQISTVRRSYNDSVLHCNDVIQTFPSNTVARVAGFKAGEFFETEAAEERDTAMVGFS